jgi:hypothetical protein
VLEKVPAAPPSIVLLSAIVGFALKLQQIPLDVTGESPSSVTSPPDFAVVCDISIISAVVSAGSAGFFSHDIRKIHNMLTTSISECPFIIFIICISQQV